jgi:hypothetical protein
VRAADTGHRNDLAEAGVKEIQLTQGLVALVDDGDYEAASQFRWYAHRQKRFNVYAKRAEPDPSGQRRQRGVSMHCWLMGATGVDHIDGNGLNNQRANLRVATAKQNAANARARLGSSRYKGVYWHAARGLWIANIRIAGRQIWIGRYGDESAAARAYDDRAREVFGEFAALNFPKPGEQSAHRPSTEE